MIHLSWRALCFHPLGVFVFDPCIDDKGFYPINRAVRRATLAAVDSRFVGPKPGFMRHASDRIHTIPVKS
jgi:hypothetical protein